MTWKLKYNTEIRRHVKSDKNNCKNEVYCYWEGLEKGGLTTLQQRRMRGDLIDNFEIIIGISNYGRHSISPHTN